MLARHQSGGDEAEYKRIRKDLEKLSTGLLTHFLNSEQLGRLCEMESKDDPFS
jgi:hypothetical protein